MNNFLCFLKVFGACLTGKTSVIENYDPYNDVASDSFQILYGDVHMNKLTRSILLIENSTARVLSQFESTIDQLDVQKD